MHLAKVVLLLIAILAAMRGATWLIAWLASRVAGGTTFRTVALANLVGLGGFLAALGWNLLPGEPLDVREVLFGVVVFATFLLVDRRWVPWTRRERARAGRSPAVQG